MYIKKLHIILVHTLLIWGFSFAQQFTNYTIKDGLPSNHIYTILQDPKGFIWFLTDKGMVKYNGDTFKTFTTKEGLPINDVWQGFATPDAKMWYLSKSSKLGFIENDSVLSFPSSNQGEIINPIFSSQIGNKVYPTGPNKSFELKEGQWELIFDNKNFRDRTNIIHPKVKTLKLTDLHGTLEIIGAKNVLLNKHHVKHDFKKRGKRKQLNDSLFCWVSDTDYFILNLNNLKLKHATFKNEISLDEVEHARINMVNNQIQITGTGFVGFLDTEMHIKKPYFFPKEINAHFALIDNTNTVWLATFSNGVYKLPYVKKNIKYTLNNQTTGMFSMLNKNLFTTIYNKGFYKFDDKTNNFNPFLKPVDYPFKPSEVKELNSIFFPSEFKMSILKSNTVETIDFENIGLNVNNLSHNFIYFENYLYALHSFGINRINPINLKIEEEFNQSGCNDLLKFKNKLFVATNNGLKEFRNDTIHKVHFLNNNFDKPILTISKISENKLLLNTDGFGSYITNLEEITPLPNSEFLIIENAFIENDAIWLATNAGIYKYVKKDANYVLKDIINMSNGLPSNTINDVIIYKNNIFASTNNGIAILHQNNKPKSLFLDIYIEKVTYNNKEISSSNPVIIYKNDNNTTFNISTINFDENTKDFSYEYKLNPVQKKWISTTSKNINFTDLVPNIYNLEFKAHGIEQSFRFQITPLWYQRLYVKIIFSLILLTLVSLLLFKIRNREIAKRITKLNTQKQLAEYELHALRSQMNPHFVFNSLNAIQYYITKNDIELSEKYLVKFSRLIRKFFDFSRTKFISLEQEIALLQNYLEIEKMRFGNDFKFEFNVDAKLSLNQQKIPSMLLQPIVENAVNHGIFHNEGKGKVTIDFIFNAPQKFTVIISDNGIGLAEAKKIKAASIKTHTSKSSEIIKDRIDLLNKSNQWIITYIIKELEHTKGTRVTLTFTNNEK